MTSSERYTHGHHESVLRAHRWRTVENSAGYLLEHLSPGRSLLDVGCGPGTVTVGLARLVAPGEVVGVDASAAAIDDASAAQAVTGSSGVRFEVGDVYHLSYDNGSFDVVHAHQLLQHLREPVAALKEMRRVCRQGGVVAARDADYGAMTWYPEVDGLEQWRTTYQAIARANGGDPDAGRKMRSYARRAGFSDLSVSGSVWCYTEPEDREYWGSQWAARVTDSSFAEQALERGLADGDALERMADAWRQWAANDDGWFIVPHGEILCRA